MSKTPAVLFPFDVDNTLLDNDSVQSHLKEHLADAYGAVARDTYWDILEELRGELGYVDNVELTKINDLLKCHLATLLNKK